MRNHRAITVVATFTTLVLAIAAIGGASATALAAPAEQATCAAPVVDDFTSGAHHAELMTGIPDPSPQTGSMVGGERRTRFSVPGAPTNPNNNPYGILSTLDILPNQAPALLVSTPYKAFHRLEVFYGLGPKFDLDYQGTAQQPCYDRFRLQFAASDVALNINMQVVAANTNNVVAGCGKNVPGQTTGAGFGVDFPFNCFVVGAGPRPDFHHITRIQLIVQSDSAIAANDYAIKKIEAVRGSGCPLPICLLLP